MTKDNVFDAVIMVDGVGRRDVERIMPELASDWKHVDLKVDPAETAVYDMAYCLQPAG